MRNVFGVASGTLFWLIALSAAGQEKLTEHTYRLKAGGAQPSARIDDMAWLSGHWTGEALGGTSDEIWSAPARER